MTLRLNDDILSQLNDANDNLFSQTMDEIKNMVYNTEFPLSDIEIKAKLAIRTLRRRQKLTNKVGLLLHSFEAAPSKEYQIFSNRSKGQHLKDEEPPSFANIEISDSSLTHLLNSEF
jgi:hypothetical protein